MCCSLKCTGQFSRTRVGGENCGSRLIFIGPGIISLIHNGTVWLQAFIPTNLMKQVKWVHLGIQSTVKCASNLAAMKACSHTVNKNKHSCSGHWVCNKVTGQILGLELIFWLSIMYILYHLILAVQWIWPCSIHAELGSLSQKETLCWWRLPAAFKWSIPST